ncbi:hypothetical protein IPJ72_02275 [Candidatus Peregrinibacteria bacterium]|nr:MAG: hypothetical protein IPJ72_02275 [Candidatus Peregrinibacteria bacterium]
MDSHSAQAPSGNTTLIALQETSLNLEEVIKDMFLVLTDKERDVIVRRFSLDNKPRQTLDKIGRHYQVTRERIRQIENIALNKLRRTVSNTKLRLVNRLAKQFIEKQGGVMLESEVISTMLNSIYSPSQMDGSIITLSLNCDSDLRRSSRTSTSEAFWYFKEIPLSHIRKIADSSVALLKKHGDVMSEDQMVSAIKALNAFKGKLLSNQLILSCISTDKRVKEVDGKWGLMEWRHVNPRSIRDKAIIVLQDARKPLHFVEIANRIAETGFDRKMVTIQAVHNELIRYSQFVLVGRGLYALNSWGYEPGTVSDVIEKLLEDNGPMSKKSIVEAVLSQRKVKVGTISLNLQKNPQFIRVGRAVYDLDLKKKTQ